jgi:anti-sigma regulatory factor (Ser/Thr protein kinase)
LYAGDDAFVAGVARFAREALEGGEAVLVMVQPRKIEMLRDELGGDAQAVQFADMGVVGDNPARIIPAWREFIDGSEGRTLRGVGEPIWPGRSAVELEEAQHHESLLNLALRPDDALWLLCPYDVEALDGSVVDEACRSHLVLHPGRIDAAETSAIFRGAHAIADAMLGAPLEQLPSPAVEAAFDQTRLAYLRKVVTNEAAAVGLSDDRGAELALAVTEVAANSIRHGGGHGDFRLWTRPESLVCEIRDHGHITAALVGRERPAAGADHGYGLWLANRLCDLVQVRSSESGTTIRIHVRVH